MIPLLVLAAGCAPNEHRVPNVVVRDSAGVSIVENRSPMSGEAPWRVAAAPTVRIGTSDGAPETQLYRVVGATHLPDGSIAIANGGTRTIRFYDAQGRYLRQAGGRGEGPGEFAALTWLRSFAGDSLLAFDGRAQRLSVFSAGGQFIRAFRLQHVTAIPEFPLAGGRLAASTRDLVPREALATGVNRDSTTIVMFSMEGVPVDTVARFPTGETYLWVEGGSVTIMPYPFARKVVLAPTDRGFVFGASDADEVRYYAASGTLERIVRREGARQRATRSDVEGFEAKALEAAQDDNRRRQLQRAFATMSVRDALPAFADLMVDAQRRVWLERYGADPEARSHWDVFDQSGRWLGTVTMPAMQVYEIGADYVLGKTQDELGVETVELHRLVAVP